MSNFATFFQKHQTDKKRQCFRNVVAPFFAKMRFRPKGGIAFLPPAPNIGFNRATNFTILSADFENFSNSEKTLCFESIRCEKDSIKVNFPFVPM